MSVDKLLDGAYDLHVHTAPDVVERKLDDLDLAERAAKVGIKGFGIKSHYFCTAERARLVHKVYPSVKPVGAIVLNNAVGGFNPLAVEMAGRDGAKIVWMPTFDSENEQAFFRAGKHKKLPFWAKLQTELMEQGKTTESIKVFEGDGITFKKEVTDVLDIIANHNMILATGHLGKKETFAIVKAAKELHVNNIIITHPNFPSTYYTKEEQKELADLGAFMEHCFTTPKTGKISWEEVYEQIRYVGPEHCIISTDLGQPSALYPDEGLREFYTNLLANGFTFDEVKQMAQDNPAQLVEGGKTATV
ncbi:DUF6282 family protein [Aquibacillus sp. 3ASR75-11]|uniref:DUF6282 family protein n=1 Tax=Terrihalobacillus insolitus TaxID=2950438 RepID=A0A9X3WT84_9BACI|nr:DUF6282 family protein [Terrihalobacillus insolitus]MDC3424218.1 DUF6282 family protein [Terrihalobacillus insolitus]